MDAQFFGVAQRRERLFLVGHLGDARACEVLFEPESMCWDTPSSREKRKAVAAASGRCVAQGSGTGRLNPDSQHDTFSIAGNIIGRKPENGGNGGGFQEPGEPMYTLTTIDRPAVAFKNHQGAANGSGTDESEPIAGYHNLNDNTTAESGINSVVRRLTPLECERLQGFPDNHTRIPWKGKPAEECPDSLRYKACGNSMAVPVMRWLGERIEAVDRL